MDLRPPRPFLPLLLGWQVPAHPAISFLCKEPHFCLGLVGCCRPSWSRQGTEGHRANQVVSAAVSQGPICPPLLKKPETFQGVCRLLPVPCPLFQLQGGLLGSPQALHPVPDRGRDKTVEGAGADCGGRWRQCRAKQSCGRGDQAREEGPWWGALSSKAMEQLALSLDETHKQGF